MSPASDPTSLLARGWPRLRAGAGPWQVTPLGGGLINQSWRVEAGGERAVLQRVNPIFDPRIHRNIRAVTERLAQAGLETPRLIPTDAGAPYLEVDEGEDSAGVWRMLSWIEGRSFDRVGSPAQARSAAALVGRVHRALDGLEHRFEGLRVGVHDTAAHLRTLVDAVDTRADHPLHAEVAALAEAITAGHAGLEALPSTPEIIGHGDLKIDNVRFFDDGVEARCLVDLDTFAPITLVYELGDACRSWCNRAGEGAPASALDLEIFTAAARGYPEGLGRELRPEERRALVVGVEWVSLELAARFGADALHERYFGWDPEHFATRGHHNLARARGQLALHRTAVAGRAARERAVAG